MTCERLPERMVGMKWSRMPKHACAAWGLTAALSATMVLANSDVVVYGATPGGVAAAVEAGRAGYNVALYEPSGHIGGLASGGLTNTDFNTFQGLGGTWKDFMDDVLDYYVATYGEGSQQVEDCKIGAWYEPKVALQVFETMLSDAGVSVFTRHELVSVALSADRTAYSSIRMEPTWTALGQAAGAAAVLALDENVAVRNVDITKLQLHLHERGAITFYVSDVAPGTTYFKAVQYLGNRGLFQNTALIGSSTTYNAPVSTSGTQWNRRAHTWHDIQPGLVLAEDVESYWRERFTAGFGADALNGFDLSADGSLTRGDYLLGLYDHLNLEPAVSVKRDATRDNGRDAMHGAASSVVRPRLVAGPRTLRVFIGDERSFTCVVFDLLGATVMEKRLSGTGERTIECGYRGGPMSRCCMKHAPAAWFKGSGWRFISAVHGRLSSGRERWVREWSKNPPADSPSQIEWIREGVCGGDSRYRDGKPLVTAHRTFGAGQCVVLDVCGVSQAEGV